MHSVHSLFHSIRLDTSKKILSIDTRVWKDLGIPVLDAIDNRISRNIWLELYDIVYRDNA